MLYKNILVEDVAIGLSNFIYADNLQATKELMVLFDYLKESKMLGIYEANKPLGNAKDYIRMYDENFYTYQTWEALVKSEKEQGDGLTEDECRMEINQTIFKLPCGWYVQYV